MARSVSKIKVEEIAISAAEQVLKMYTDQEKKKKREYRFRNTKLLLKNYNSLKDYLKCAKDNIKEVESIIDIDDIDITNKDELYIKSIRDSKLKTIIILAHIESSIEQLRIKILKKDQYHKYRVIEGIYIHGKSYDEISEEVNCGIVSARRWEKEMINELSILLFGVEGIKLDI